MTLEQALQLLVQMAAMAPAPKAAHVQAEQAIKLLVDLINEKKAGPDGK